MNKDDEKKLDKVTAEEAEAQELTTEDLDNVNGGKVRFKSKTWWDKIKGKDENKKDS